LWQHHIPFFLTSAKKEAAEEVAQHPIAALYYSIALGMVGGSPAFVYSPEAAEVAHQLRLELSSLVQM